MKKSKQQSSKTIMKLFSGLVMYWTCNFRNLENLVESNRLPVNCD